MNWGVFVDITRMDISKTDYLLRSKSGGYTRMYFNSNENLRRILSNFDVKDKNVLSVLGSGDQAFHFYNRGARNVDVFDKNRLAILYFYLRIWFIKYENIYYPPLRMNKSIIKRLLDKVEPKDVNELDAFNYWHMYLDYFDDHDTKWLFHPTNPGIGYNRIDDLNRIKEILTNKKFNIFNVDISKDKVNDIKYDIIFKSNVTDYIFNNDYDSYLENLDSLLSDDGIIVSTNVLYRYPHYKEVKKFIPRFVFSPMPKYYDSDKKEFVSPGYVYKKRV